MTSKQISLGAACLLALSAAGASYDFTSGTSSTNGWQPYTPLSVFGVATTFSDGPAGYRMQSAASSNPGLFGPARVGSFLLGTYSDFSLSFNVPSYSASPTEFFGAATRISNVGLGTSSGYVMGYDNSTGDLFISKVIGEASQGPIGAGAAAPVALVPGQGYEFTFNASGSSFNGAVYSLGNLSTPLATVFGTDSQFTSGQVGLLAAAQVATGTADVTFGGFSVVPEPASGALFLLGGLTFWAARWRRRD